jgi:hypothetical protein
MVGKATMFAELPVPGDKQKTDLTGKKWDVGVPSMFHFEYVKESSAKHGGILIKRTEIFGDSAPAVVEMMKRGMIKPDQLLA